MDRSCTDSRSNSENSMGGGRNAGVVEERFTVFNFGRNFLGSSNSSNSENTKVRHLPTAFSPEPDADLSKIAPYST